MLFISQPIKVQLPQKLSHFFKIGLFRSQNYLFHKTVPVLNGGATIVYRG